MTNATEPDDGALGGPRLAAIAGEHGTPVWVYDAARIRAQADRLRAFDTIRFAQKALSNIHVLALLREHGVLVDAVSAGELERALAAGYRVGGEHDPVVFTADVVDRPTLARIIELGVPVNAGSPDMLAQVGQASPGHRVWLRVNPGFGHGHSRKTNTGGPSSKHGIWHEQLAACLAVIDEHRLDLAGLHMHIGSGVDYQHLSQVCEAMAGAVRSIGRPVQAISAGGGLPVPYREDEPEMDVDTYVGLWQRVRDELSREFGNPVRLEVEPGRYLVAEAGVLVSEVRARKHQGDNEFVLVDAGFNDLMRPAMYGAAHQASVLNPDGEHRTSGAAPRLLAGPLCESGDVFTQAAGGEVTPVPLPEARVGDLVVFHDAGAYGSSMSSNYNSRPLAPEVLVDGDDVRLIRRRQTIADLLALEDMS